MRPPLIPGHDDREILGFLRSGLNLPLSTIRQFLIFCFALDVDTHVGLEAFVSNRPLP